MEKINILENKIHQAVDLLKRLRQENRHLKEELALREEENLKAKKLFRKNEILETKINQVKERLTKLLEKFEKYKI